MLRIWHCLCLLFLLININILIDESYGVIYKIVNSNKPIQYLDCLNLSEIVINKTRINLNEIKNDLNYHLRRIQKIKISKYHSILNTIEKILNQTKSRDYLIYQNRICFIFNKIKEMESFNKLLYYLKIYPDLYVFNNETFSFFKLESIYSKLNQILIQHIESPYSSCSKDYSNFRCLNDKIKKIQPLSRYFYRSDDNESIELNYQINQTIIDNEIKIIKQCNQIDCNINLFYFNTVNTLDQKLDQLILKSFLSISKLEFYLQLIGLVVLFLNIPIYKLTIKIINFINLESLKIKILKLKFIKLKLKKFMKILDKLKLRNNIIKLFKLLKRKYLKINYLIILILLILLICLFSRSIYNFIDERDYPSMKSISVDSIKPELSIVICISIYQIKGFYYNIYNRSLSEIENDTDNALNSAVKDIYLQFLNKKIPTKWQLESKLIAFKNFDRCFQLRIFLNEPKYQSIFSVTKLVIEFNIYGDIYFLTDNELFNSKSYQHYPSYSFKKRILKRSKLNKNKKCKDFNLAGDNCISKWNCIDQCINREVYNKIKNLTEYYDLFIDKKYFIDIKWANLYIRPHSYNNAKIYKNISKECEEKYLEFDFCIDIKFEYQSEINYQSGNKEEIDLNYEVIYKEEEEVSIFKLLLDLLNIQGNLFGLNFLNLSIMILNLFRLNLKLKNIIKLLIYLICLIGFIYHLWSIYDEIINIQIIYSEHYELITLIQTPDLIFCFDFNYLTRLINPNYKLTYEYLDKITSDELNVNKIFDRIEYLNGLNWIKLDNKTNFKDNNLEIRIFYYLDRKCFKIVQNIDYNRNQFNKFNDDDGLILKIIFNRTHLDDRIFYFFTKTKYKIEFSKIQQLKLKTFSYNFKSFIITHELIKRDEFELIKNPLSLSSEVDQNDLDKFFTKLINYLDTKLNLVTFKLPFNKTDSNLKKELDDNLFIQLYNQQQQQHNQTNSNTNHLRQHSINYLKIYDYEPPIPDLEFNLSFYRKVIVISNKISLIKLIINLLNVLSFWFDLGWGYTTPVVFDKARNQLSKNSLSRYLKEGEVYDSTDSSATW